MFAVGGLSLMGIGWLLSRHGYFTEGAASFYAGIRSLKEGKEVLDLEVELGKLKEIGLNVSDEKCREVAEYTEVKTENRLNSLLTSSALKNAVYIFSFVIPYWLLGEKVFQSSSFLSTLGAMWLAGDVIADKVQDALSNKEESTLNSVYEKVVKKKKNRSLININLLKGFKRS
jgi:hypothetical protein